MTIGTFKTSSEFWNEIFFDITLDCINDLDDIEGSSVRANVVSANRTCSSLRHKAFCTHSLFIPEWSLSFPFWDFCF